MTLTDGMRDDGIDREAILARRAWLISTALAALSCGPPRGGTSSPTDASEGGPGTEPGGAADPDHASEGRTPGSSQADALDPLLAADPKADPPVPDSEPMPKPGPWLSRLPSWAVVDAEAPPRDVPPGLSKVDAEPLTRQAAELALLYSRLQALWTRVPALCSLDRAECHGVWGDFLGEIEELDASVRGLRPLCGFGAAARTTVVQRVDAHQRYLAQRVFELLAAVRHDHEARDPEALITMEALQRERVVAMPCLSCMAPQGMTVHGLAVSFQTSSAELSPQAEDVLRLLADELRAFPDARLEVRGHGDPDEGGAADSLAQARAQVVIDRLVALGVSRSRLQLRAFGSRVGVAGVDRGVGGPTNERVDFEVVR